MYDLMCNDGGARPIKNFLAAMLTKMSNEVVNQGVSIQYRMDGRLFNLRRFMAKSKTSTTKFRDLLFADDCVGHTTDDMQEMVNTFANADASFGLQINIKKTEYMFQPAPGTASIAKDIFINGEPLKKASYLSYLDSVISDDCAVLYACKKVVEHMMHFSQDCGASEEYK